jgi:2-hydroxymuconate-semialdehyde hydrolase
MSADETKYVQTGNYQTFIHEAGDNSSETIIFLHGS